jgi:hypothetical protein
VRSHRLRIVAKSSFFFFWGLDPRPHVSYDCKVIRVYPRVGVLKERRPAQKKRRFSKTCSKEIPGFPEYSLFLTSAVVTNHSSAFFLRTGINSPLGARGAAAALVKAGEAFGKP